MLAFVGCPTNPISIIFSIFESESLNSTFNFVALKRLFLFPLNPIAFPPESLIALTISVFISLAKTSSTTFTVSESVTRKPSTNLEVIFLVFNFLISEKSLLMSCTIYFSICSAESLSYTLC